MLDRVFICPRFPPRSTVVHLYATRNFILFHRPDPWQQYQGWQLGTIWVGSQCDCDPPFSCPVDDTVISHSLACERVLFPGSSNQTGVSSVFPIILLSHCAFSRNTSEICPPCYPSVLLGTEQHGWIVGMICYIISQTSNTSHLRLWSSGFHVAYSAAVPHILHLSLSHKCLPFSFPGTILSVPHQCPENTLSSPTWQPFVWLGLQAYPCLYTISGSVSYWRGKSKQHGASPSLPILSQLLAWMLPSNSIFLEPFCVIM